MDITSLFNDVQELKRDMVITKTCMEKLTQIVEKIEKSVAQKAESGGTKQKEETDQMLQMERYGLGMRVGQLEKSMQTNKVEKELECMTTRLAFLETQIKTPTLALPEKIVPEVSCNAASNSEKVAHASQTQKWISCKKCPTLCELEPLEKNSHKNLPIVSSRCGFTGIIAALLAHGLCVNDVVDGGEEPFVSDGYGMLHCAVAGHHTKLVKLLLTEGANVHMKGKDGKTPLHVAAEEGHLDIVTLLVESGSDTNIRDVESKTPLSYAIKNKRLEVIEFLCEYI